jgi:DNA/RNA-binding domain of Phe-tRNA-synthetase-like protein
MKNPQITVDPSLSGSGLQFALVWGTGLQNIVAPESLPIELADLVAQIHAEGKAPWAEGVREAVRNMLRHGKYKPTGRGKPASEFLLGAALEGTFPLLNVPANINNFISLLSGLPISVFDADIMGDVALIRRGSAGEKYVFNPSGQEIDLQDLLCVCRKVDGQWIPTGNPVKDAMVTKITADTRNVVAVIYAPPSFSSDTLETLGREFASLLTTQGKATEVETAFLHC